MDGGRTEPLTRRSGRPCQQVSSAVRGRAVIAVLLRRPSFSLLGKGMSGVPVSAVGSRALCCGSGISTVTEVGADGVFFLYLIQPARILSEVGLFEMLAMIHLRNAH